jgi:hypothetical protein
MQEIRWLLKRFFPSSQHKTQEYREAKAYLAPPEVPDTSGVRLGRGLGEASWPRPD